MDVCSLDFGEESFNAVIDKGTMDSLFCAEGSINKLANYCAEVSRSVRHGKRQQRVMILKEVVAYAGILLLHIGF